MKNLYATIVIASFLFSCNQNDQVESPLPQSTDQTTSKPTENNSEVMPETDFEEELPMTITRIRDAENFRWGSNSPKRMAYAFDLEFDHEFAVYVLNNQYIYFFFTQTTNALKYEQIQLLWSYKTDCLDDFTLFDQSHGVKNYPKHGDVFSVYKIHNDTTLRVEYKFPEWVEKVNTLANDSVFPKFLYVKERRK